MKALFIDVGKEEFWWEEVNNVGVLDYSIDLHFEEKSYKYDVYSDKNIIIIGTSYLKYPGAYRAMIVFRSPLHGSLHASSLGDFGEFIKRAGFDFIIIKGRATKSKFIVIKNEEIQFLEEEIPIDIKKKEKELKQRLSKEVYKNIPFRVLLAGIGSKNTSFGSLISWIDVAGRGGAGSVLVRAHNIVGLSIGGNRDIEYVFPKADIIGKTKKYREKGTFKGNYEHYGNELPMYNYLNKTKNINLTEKIQKLLAGYSPQILTCGERCPAACKKIENNIKIDYEPAHAVGPFVGIFDRKRILEGIDLIDRIGLDAIYTGHVIAGILEKENKLNPPIETSEDIKSLILSIATGDINIERARNSKFSDYVFYIPFGDTYDMTPNFYYSIGVFLPTAIPGTYLTDYSKNPTFDSIFDRMIKEYQINNLSVCRFHRKWLEPMLDYSEVPEKLRLLYLYRRYAKAEPRIWESDKALEVVNTIDNPEKLWNSWIEYIQAKLNI